MPRTIKCGAYVINLDEDVNVGAHWIALYNWNIEIIYFGSFGVEHIPKEIKKIIGNKHIKTNIFRIEANNSIISGFFWTGLIDFMLAVKTSSNYSSWLLPWVILKN